MSKYGKGLGKEIVEGVKKGEIKEPLTIKKIKEFCEMKGWKPSEKYINVFLANTSTDNHSPTYVKYIEKNSSGEYVVAKEFRL